MNKNPWEVESIMAFYFLKCPECEFDTQKETDFEEHAKENHPLSLVGTSCVHDLKQKNNRQYIVLYTLERKLSV